MPANPQQVGDTLTGNLFAFAEWLADREGVSFEQCAPDEQERRLWDAESPVRSDDRGHSQDPRRSIVEARRMTTVAEITPLFTESWEDRALRLAQELKAACPDPFTATRKQRESYSSLRYALQCHIQDVPS